MPLLTGSSLRNETSDTGEASRHCPVCGIPIYFGEGTTILEETCEGCGTWLFEIMLTTDFRRIGSKGRRWR